MSSSSRLVATPAREPSATSSRSGRSTSEPPALSLTVACATLPWSPNSASRPRGRSSGSARPQARAVGVRHHDRLRQRRRAAGGRHRRRRRRCTRDSALLIADLVDEAIAQEKEEAFIAARGRGRTVGEAVPPSAPSGARSTEPVWRSRDRIRRHQQVGARLPRDQVEDH